MMLSVLVLADQSPQLLGLILYHVNSVLQGAHFHLKKQKRKRFIKKCLFDAFYKMKYENPHHFSPFHLCPAGDPRERTRQDESRSLNPQTL